MNPSKLALILMIPFYGGLNGIAAQDEKSEKGSSGEEVEVQYMLVEEFRFLQEEGKISELNQDDGFLYTKDGEENLVHTDIEEARTVLRREEFSKERIYILYYNDKRFDSGERGLSVEGVNKKRSEIPQNRKKTILLKEKISKGIK